MHHPKSKKLRALRHKLDRMRGENAALRAKQADVSITTGELELFCLYHNLYNASNALMFAGNITPAQATMLNDQWKDAVMQVNRFLERRAHV